MGPHLSTSAAASGAGQNDLKASAATEAVMIEAGCLRAVCCGTSTTADNDILLWFALVGLDPGSSPHRCMSEYPVSLVISRWTWDTQARPDDVVCIKQQHSQGSGMAALLRSGGDASPHYYITLILPCPALPARPLVKHGDVRGHRRYNAQSATTAYSLISRQKGHLWPDHSKGELMKAVMMKRRPGGAAMIGERPDP